MDSYSINDIMLACCRVIGSFLVRFGEEAGNLASAILSEMVNELTEPDPENEELRAIVRKAMKGNVQ